MSRKNNKQASPRAIKVDPWTAIQHWNISARGALEVDITEYRSGQKCADCMTAFIQCSQNEKNYRSGKEIRAFQRLKRWWGWERSELASRDICSDGCVLYLSRKTANQCPARTLDYISFGENQYVRSLCLIFLKLCNMYLHSSQNNKVDWKTYCNVVNKYHDQSTVWT